MVVAGISPYEAWKQPILRLLDTADGVFVGLLVAWIGRHIGSEDSRDNLRKLEFQHRAQPMMKNVTQQTRNDE